MSWMSYRPVVLLVAAAVVSGGALAQESQDVTIEASRIERVQVRTSSIVPVHELSVAQRVNCGDLDLTTSSGMARLEMRVRDAAKKSCEVISQAYPLAKPGDRRCAALATREAMDDVRELIAAN